MPTHATTMTSDAAAAATSSGSISPFNSASNNNFNHCPAHHHHHLLEGPPTTIRDYDHILLHFADNRQIFAQAVPKQKRPGYSSNAGGSGGGSGGGIGGGAGGAAPHHPCKINKRAYATHNLIGLPYGTVVEVSRDGNTLTPLPEGEDLLPNLDVFLMNNDDNNIPEGGCDYEEEEEQENANDTLTPSFKDQVNGDSTTTITTTTTSATASTIKQSTNSTATHNDNRNLIDDNTSQRLTPTHVDFLKSSSTNSGSDIVAALVSNSSTFSSKTKYSQAKYVARKQMKYQIRCRIVQVNPYTMCAAMHSKDARKMANLRDDTLGRILSTANVHAGQYVLVADDAVQGILTASCVKRMGGYGTVMGLYPGKFVPGYVDVTAGRMNYNLRERQMLRWISLGEAFGTNESNGSNSSRRESSGNKCTDSVVAVDIEKRDRERISWPAPLMPHTRQYISNELQTEQKINVFLEKRSARFARKLTRYSALELRELIGSFRNEKEVYSIARHNTNGHDNDDDEGGGRRERVRMDEVDERKKRNVEEGAERMRDDGDDDDNDGTRTANTSTTPSPPRQCDSLVIATKYDPTTTLFGLLPYLAPSCPFVVYSEFLEPLLNTFHALQNYFVPEYGDSKDVTGVKSSDKDNEDIDTDDNILPGGSRGTGAGAIRPPPMMQRRNIAINLRLTDSWFREYQVLEGRTHPNMSMSQNGGYILAGTKLCPLTGTNELDDNVMKGIRAKLGGRRKQANTKRGGGLRAAKRKKVENGGGGCGEKESEGL